MKYNILGSAISVEINDEFEVYSILTKTNEQDKQLVTMYLKDINTGILDLIEEMDGEVVECDAKQSFYEVTRMIEKLNKKGFFQYYIDRYDYLLDCADKGANMNSN